jgi:hypothetical protein
MRPGGGDQRFPLWVFMTTSNNFLRLAPQPAIVGLIVFIIF